MPTASSSCLLGMRSSSVWATWMEPGPIRNGVPQASPNAGMSVVYATTVVSIPASEPSRRAGISIISRASAFPATAAAPRRRVICARAVALLADYEQHSEVAYAAFEQRLGGGEHGGDDALGVARAASPDVVAVFTGGDERRHGIHVSGERDGGPVAPAGEDIGAVRLDFGTLGMAAIAGGEGRDVVQQLKPDTLLVAGDGFGIDERPR